MSSDDEIFSAIAEERRVLAATVWDLTDIVVHGHDIRRPLHLAHRITDERQIVVLDFITSTPSHGIFPISDAALHWKATDVDWTFGSGPTVQGPAASLMLVLTGRTSALADVTGPGVEHLAKSAE